MPKPRPLKHADFVFNPERDATYVHFESAAAHPFDSNAAVLGRRNAWWLGDAALLSYWDVAEAIPRFNAAGMEAELLDAGGLQAYVAWTDSFLIVAFRGTEPDEWADLFDDLQFKQEPWDGPSRHVHSGFKAAIERVWPTMEPMLDALGQTRTVWFSGHSLGGAVATLAGDRYTHTAGVCTLGSPRVGDPAFAAAYDARFGARALRYVADTDIVTHVPPPIIFACQFKHAGALRQVSSAGQIATDPPALAHFFNALIGEPLHVLEVVNGLQNGDLTQPPKFLLDHMPRGYAVDMWNDYEANGD
jgi:triacylglycerol lipase